MSIFLIPIMSQKFGLWSNAGAKLNERLQYQFQYRRSELKRVTKRCMVSWCFEASMPLRIETVSMEKAKTAILWTNNTLPWLCFKFMVSRGNEWKNWRETKFQTFIIFPSPHCCDIVENVTFLVINIRNYGVRAYSCQSTEILFN